jgi:hypothetical protein
VTAAVSGKLVVVVTSVVDEVSEITANDPFVNGAADTTVLSPSEPAARTAAAVKFRAFLIRCFSNSKCDTDDRPL